MGASSSFLTIEKNNREEKRNAQTSEKISNFVYCLLEDVDKMNKMWYNIYMLLLLYKYYFIHLVKSSFHILGQLPQFFLSVSIAEDVDKMNKMCYNNICTLCFCFRNFTHWGGSCCCPNFFVYCLLLKMLTK